MRGILFAAIALALVGCSTGYHKKSWSGGYSDMAMGNDMVKVSFNGNGYTGADTVQNYFLRRCAEVTKEQGFDYFALVDEEAQAQTMNLGTTTNGTLSKNYYGGGYTYAANSHANTATRHARTGMIKMFKEGSQPQTAISAGAYLKNFDSN